MQNYSCPVQATPPLAHTVACISGAKLQANQFHTKKQGLPSTSKLVTFKIYNLKVVRLSNYTAKPSKNKLWNVSANVCKAWAHFLSLLHANNSTFQKSRNFQYFCAIFSHAKEIISGIKADVTGLFLFLSHMLKCPNTGQHPMRGLTTTGWRWLLWGKEAKS